MVIWSPLAGVALAMGSAGLSSKIKIADPLERRLVSDIAVAGMSSVVRGRFDVENLATQLITDAAVVGMQQLQTKTVSDEYQQSKQASRGAGHITQTTIEQQWESQLINDAEFTANTPLPSVTFDVNNSYVSQRLGQRVGEEVSHFYHPTPPPPRNVNGFWRGVDDVLKMREGTIKAFSSVVSNDDQIPTDRWEAIGYAVGVPLAMGAMAEVGLERLGAEALETIYQESQQLGKGLMQASRLVNRWGFFGHNALDSTELSLPSLSKHPLEGWTADQVVDYANQLGLKTNQDQLILWSGLGQGDAGIRLSQEYAAINGGITLEMTRGGKWLDELDLFGANSPFSRIEARQIWANVSTRMIQQASGQVRSLVGTINPSSIYRAEQTEILMNEKILGLDELNLKPRFIFGNYWR
ncbi:hypothetical protein [Rickettsiella endosymbiont of Xylota segnis]|uniref:hypothetical protein n=1 Tax=Rickettsiella endosymbiont of Xylota segnis TaxID=3066238 RepID=UPI0030D333DB